MQLENASKKQLKMKQTLLWKWWKQKNTRYCNWKEVLESRSATLHHETHLDYNHRVIICPVGEVWNLHKDVSVQSQFRGCTLCPTISNELASCHNNSFKICIPQCYTMPGMVKQHIIISYNEHVIFSCCCAEHMRLDTRHKKSFPKWNLKIDIIPSCLESTHFLKPAIWKWNLKHGFFPSKGCFPQKTRCFPGHTILGVHTASVLNSHLVAPELLLVNHPQTLICKGRVR